MILVISTSSPLISVGAFEKSKRIDFMEQLAPRSAGGVLFEILEVFLLKNSFSMGDFDSFVADIGPGSFTGIKSGITVIKSMGYIHQKPVQGVFSFDLLPSAPLQYVSIRKEKYVIRSVDKIFSSEKFPEDGIGYCLSQRNSKNIYPSAKNYAYSSGWIKPEELSPFYMEDPNISSPKVSYSRF